MKTQSKAEFSQLLSKNEIGFQLKKYCIGKNQILKLSLTLDEPKVN